MTEAAAPRFVCSQANCKVAESGRCMDGVDPSACQHATPASEAVPEAKSLSESLEEPGTIEAPAEPPGLPIHSGEALGPVEARAVTRRVPSTLILVMGGVKCGKTTLLASMYERLRLGRVEQFRFRGSRTLIGFERRYFNSRTSSGREKAHTGRTGTKESGFLHLELEHAAEAVRHHLLMADVSGESFRALRDTPADAIEVPSLQRANVLALMLDGRKLTDDAERNVELANIRLLGKGLLEKAAIPSASVVQVVVAKWDRVRDADQEDARRADAEHLCETLAKYHLPVKLFITECRGANWGDGLDELLEAWAGVPAPDFAQTKVPVNRWNLSRSFHRFPLEAEPTWL